MTPTLPDVPQVEIAIVEMTNAFRRENNLTDVRTNPTLTKAARDYAAFLARSGAFSHTADGREPAERAESAGYTYCMVAENLALNLDSRGFESLALAGQAIEGWKASPGHRKNMLTPHVVEIGVGVVRVPDKDPKFISVQLFGRPKSLSYRFKISNVSTATVTYSFGGETHALEPRYTVTHSACVPGEVAFSPPAGTRTDAALRARYLARDGQLFTLRGGAGGSLALEVEDDQQQARDAGRGIRDAVRK
jgi:hypothetical protein